MQVLLESSAKTGVNTFIQLITVSILFVLVFAGAYWTTRVIGKYQMHQMKNTNLSVVEAMSVGPGKSLQLIKVGTSFILVGVTKDHITLVKEMDANQLDMNLVQSKDLNVPFAKYLEKVIKKNKGS